MTLHKAVVLLSGGLDSATALAIARREGFECFALSIAYGQRHAVELTAAAKVAALQGATEHRVITVDLGTIGGSALTDPSLAVPEAQTEGIPITYVPARNTIILSLAMAWAEVLRAEAIFVGVNARDYSVSGNARVWLRGPSGARLIPIKDAYELPEGPYETISVDPVTLQMRWKRIAGRYQHRAGGKRCFRIRLERGQEIEVTEDHSLFTIDDGGNVVPIRGSEIAAGTPLVVPFDLSQFATEWSNDRTHIDLRSVDHRLNRGVVTPSIVEDGDALTNRLRRVRIPLHLPLTDDFLRIVGLWLAEGGKDPDSLSKSLAFSIGGLDGAAELLARYFRQFGIRVSKSPANDFDYRLCSSVAYEVFRRLDLLATAKSGRKRFPAWFWTLSQRQRRIVVAALWDGDGSVVWHGEAPISQKSHALIDDLYHCLCLDGIFATLKRTAHSQKRLALTRSSDIERFVELYPLWHVAKRDSLRRAASIGGRDKSVGIWKCNGIWAAVAGSTLAPGRKTQIYNAGGKYDVSVRSQRRAFAGVPALEFLVESKLAFLRVVSINVVQHEFMYDFSVEDDENFLADGFLAHNSGYPDCRPEFIAAFDSLARLATKAAVEGTPVRVHAPLIDMSKAEIIRRGIELGVDFGLTVSCYQADEEGRACGRCDSCRLRREGFAAARVPDPTRYQPALDA